jgi:hypothetical protein
MPASRTSAATPAAPGVYVVTAADFVSGSATIAARHSFSFSMPTGGVSIPVPVVAASDARAGSTSGSPTRSAARPHRKRAREYVIGQRFQMRHETYVAFGRACNRDSVCVLIRPDRIHSTGDRVNALVRNVVYPALLQ